MTVPSSNVMQHHLFKQNSFNFLYHFFLIWVHYAVIFPSKGS